MTNKEIAVIGGGVSGIAAAFLLSRRHSVTIFEKASYLGGHTNSVVIEQGEDAGLAVDTGFIVCNDKTYPNFHRFLKSLNVGVRYSDMSFGYYSDQDEFHYAGRTVSSIFSDRRHLTSPKFYKFLWDIGHFARRAKKFLDQMPTTDTPLGDFLVKNRISADVIRRFVLPMGAAIWSCSAENLKHYPAAPFLKFFENHGLLSFKNRPKWQTVVGASHAYVKAFQRQFKGRIVLNGGVEKVSRSSQSEVVLKLHDQTQLSFDAVVIATHADQALRLLERPSESESRLLGSWRYEKNKTFLHTDARFLPPVKRAWASWNFREESSAVDQSALSVSYYMNLLQGFSSNKPYLVTLNPKQPIDEKQIIREIDYTHPYFDGAAVASQKSLSRLNGVQSTWFCGSYFGNGFHEDALTSGIQVAKDFGEEL